MIQPRRWDLQFIRRFMLVFGSLSSVFDYLTFGVLLLVLHATPEQFRTGWFVESVISAVLVVFVVRSRRPFFASRPGKALGSAALVIVAVTLGLPFTPLATPFAFTPLPLATVVLLGGIVVGYLFAADYVKRRFYQWLQS